jgi:enoyl-CoA hydratase/carnithine racemase
MLAGICQQCKGIRRKVAMVVMLACEAIGAERAYPIGLVSRIAPRGKLIERR